MKTVRARAPLRLGLAGGGTDVSPYCDQFGGAVLNATISLYAHATVSPSDDGRIHFMALDQEVSESLELAGELAEGNKLALHRGVYNRLVREFGNGEPLAITMTTSVDAPAGSGLGSSSTLVVAMVHALAEYMKVPLGEYDLAALAYQIERVDIGLHGGRQDQYAAAFGGINFMEMQGADRVLVNPLRVKEWIVSEIESSLVLYFTGRSRSSAAIIEEESRNVREANVNAIDAMHHTKQEAFRMKEALLRGQIQMMGDVMRTAWGFKKRMASNISNPRIDHLYDTAVAQGAFCGKVTGAGGGGFMMFLVDPRKKLKVVRSLEAMGEGYVLNCNLTPVGSQAWTVDRG